jgi:transposase
MSTSPLFVGIDAAKAELVVALGPSRDLLAVPNDESDIRQVLEHLQAASPALVVLEATGGYETAAVAALAAAGFPWSWPTHAKFALLPRPWEYWPRRTA